MDNSTLPFGISSNGLHVTGTSGMYAGDSLVRWSANGPTAIPMPSGASTAVARGVHSLGWVVGHGGGPSSVPFVYDGNQTYEIASLVPGGTGWDFGTNTSSSAQAITLPLLRRRRRTG